MININQVDLTFKLINTNYTPYSDYKNPIIYAPIRLSKIHNLRELFEEIEKQKDNINYEKYKNFWLKKWYNYLCSLNIEIELGKLQYIEKISKDCSDEDIKFMLSEDKYDIKLTFVPDKFIIDKEIFEKINDSDNIDVRNNLCDYLYKHLKNNDEYKKRVNKDYKPKKFENRIYFLIYSKSKDKYKAMKTKSNFKLINDTIKKYFENEEVFNKYIFNYKNNKVVIIPIITD